MSELIFYGVPQSSYVRTARFACGEKGVAHTLDVVDFRSDAYRQRHPWGKIPAMRHDAVTLYETSAICRYIDTAFEGPPLQPATPSAQALMEQWISAFNSYIYPHAIRDYALQYIIPRGPDGTPNRDLIDTALPLVEKDFALLDAAYAGRDWLAGDALSLADIFMAPIVATVGMFPEGRTVLDRCKNVQRVMSAIDARPAYRAAQPASPLP